MFQKIPNNNEDKLCYKLQGVDSKIDTEYDIKEDYYNDESVIEIEPMSETKIKFTWFGFYNNKTKKREYTDNPFDRNQNSVILNKCN